MNIINELKEQILYCSRQKNTTKLTREEKFLNDLPSCYRDCLLDIYDNYLCLSVSYYAYVWNEVYFIIAINSDNKVVVIKLEDNEIVFANEDHDNFKSWLNNVLFTKRFDDNFNELIDIINNFLRKHKIYIDLNYDTNTYSCGVFRKGDD